MSRQEAIDQYARALKLGRKCYKERLMRDESPYPAVLDELLAGVPVAGQMDMGLVEIPSELIAGTKTEGRRAAFAANFMPLMEESSEFAFKWISLCAAHLGDEGIREPIRCFEYLGNFYVQEGNKRASVLKSYGAPTVPGYVVRVLPIWSEEPEIRAYYDFMQHYQLTGLYRVRFTRPGSFAKLQAALGYPPDHVWTDEERQRFSSGLFYFHEAYAKLGGAELPITEADALLIWLKVYPLEKLRGFSSAELARSLEGVWPDIKALVQGDPVEVSTEPEDAEEKTDAESLAEAGDGPEQGLLDRLLHRTPDKLRIAFVNQYTPEESDWIRGHDLGRQYLEAMLGAKVSLRSYDGVGVGETADAAMEQAVADGAQVIFATTPPLIAACRKLAAQHPEVKVLNCSAAMPCAGVRSYYTRIYECKFITGALAGALCRDGRIGYVADSPIFGVPAGINAFALGAQLTNPAARVYVRWFCVEDALQKLVEQGFSYISARDLPSPDRQAEPFGLCRCDGRRRLHSVASPYWHWGSFYLKLVRSILDGRWDALARREEGRAVSYWWGLRSRTTDVLLSDELPASARQLVGILRQGLSSGTLSPFQRPLRDQSGALRSDGNEWFSPEAILQMDWLCQGVEGSIPRFEELLPVNRRLVRLQGVYRDTIPPEKEETVL